MEAVALKLDVVLAAQTPDYLSTFAPQVSALRKLAHPNRVGLVERVAYTWFNRLTALRYLDAKGWHPFNARVLTPVTAQESQPELLKLTRAGALPSELQGHTDPALLNDLLDGRIPSPDRQGEVYRHLVLAACRFYHALLPDVFEKLDDETELLLPDDLLTEHSVVSGFRTEISDADCGEVELLGWLYQFYISERKDQVMARKSAIPTEDIPAVTQLFTPHWIVRYLVENSLGRLWLLNRPGSQLRKQMPYYIDGEHEAHFLEITKPEEIRVLDPAVGSGHMLTYAFDLLHAIYEEEGYPPSDIPRLILEHNLFGLDIDYRAAQLAELALVFKAREKSNRFFQAEHITQPHIIVEQNISFDDTELHEYISGFALDDSFNQTIFRLLPQFQEASTVGSLIVPALDGQTIASTRLAIETNTHKKQLLLVETHRKIMHVLRQAEALTQRYHVVIANPPYMGTKGMTLPLAALVKEQFPNSRSDLSAVFIERNLRLAIPSGFVAMITMQSWMFLSSLKNLRSNLLAHNTILNMAHCGTRAFDSIGGEVVSTTAFVIARSTEIAYRGTFVRLTNGHCEAEKDELLRSVISGEGDSPIRYRASTSDFMKIPGHPIAYWVSQQILKLFSEEECIGDVVKPRQGMSTNDNARFLRQWFEVEYDNIGLSIPSSERAIESGLKWFPYNKGGSLRKWYGNCEYVVNWQNDGEEVKAWLVNNPKDPNTSHWSRRIINTEFYFKSGITWADITTSSFAARHADVGSLFDVKGSSAFPAANSYHHVLGLMNSCLMNMFMMILNPTVTFQVGDIARVPFVRPSEPRERFNARIDQMISLARSDWNNFETAWDFQGYPLLRPGLKGRTLEASWRNWEVQSTAAIRQMKELETENNRLFIEAYGLAAELKPEVPEEQITLARADARRDMSAFLSYVVGCMMGRYSLDSAGLIIANAGESLRVYLEKVGKPIDQLCFAPDEDGIIPVLDGEWFEDDIVARTRAFLRATFGEATLRENIRFVEESLGKDLRKYFLTDFYKDHLQTYKKRPIYWMVQSPRKGFSVLLYMHRYTRDTMNVVLNKYLREYQVKLRSRLDHLTKVQSSDTINPRDKTAARKESDKLLKTLHDCEEWERQTILPFAQARIDLDLDDGVKANYLKLVDALAPVPGLAAEEE
jgi:type II restriction/modification system DNA methylase subunit YeeA